MDLKNTYKKAYRHIGALKIQPRMAYKNASI